MFEYHGWAVVRESTGDVEDSRLDALINDIRHKIENIARDNANPFMAVNVINGNYHVLVSGLSNRRESRVNEVFEFYDYLATIAPGSYGLLNFWDDEDSGGYQNAFRTLVLARGKAIVKEDTYLSPCVPTIEDQYP